MLEYIYNEKYAPLGGMMYKKCVCESTSYTSKSWKRVYGP